MARSVYRKQNLRPSSRSFWLSAATHAPASTLAAKFRRRVDPGHANAVGRSSRVSRHRHGRTFGLPQQHASRRRHRQCRVLFGLLAIDAFGFDRERGAPFRQQRVIRRNRFAQMSRRSRFADNSAQLVDAMRHVLMRDAPGEFRPFRSELFRNLRGAVHTRNRDAACMKLVRYRIDRGVTGCPRENHVVRRRHQDDASDLAVLFGHRHQRRRRAPLRARSKPVEKAEDQAVLGLASQQKRLNALKELASIRKEFHLNGQSNSPEQ